MVEPNIPQSTALPPETGTTTTTVIDPNSLLHTQIETPNANMSLNLMNQLLFHPMDPGTGRGTGMVQGSSQIQLGLTQDQIFQQLINMTGASSLFSTTIDGGDLKTKPDVGNLQLETPQDPIESVNMALEALKTSTFETGSSLNNQEIQAVQPETSTFPVAKIPLNTLQALQLQSGVPETGTASGLGANIHPSKPENTMTLVVNDNLEALEGLILELQKEILSTTPSSLHLQCSIPETEKSKIDAMYHQMQLEPPRTPMFQQSVKTISPSLLQCFLPQTETGQQRSLEFPNMMAAPQIQPESAENQRRTTTSSTAIPQMSRSQFRTLNSQFPQSGVSETGGSDTVNSLRQGSIILNTHSLQSNVPETGLNASYTPIPQMISQVSMATNLNPLQSSVPETEPNRVNTPMPQVCQNPMLNLHQQQSSVRETGPNIANAPIPQMADPHTITRNPYSLQSGPFETGRNTSNISIPQMNDPNPITPNSRSHQSTAPETGPNRVHTPMPQKPPILYRTLNAHPQQSRVPETRPHTSSISVHQMNRHATIAATPTSHQSGVPETAPNIANTPIPPQMNQNASIAATATAHQSALSETGSNMAKDAIPQTPQMVQAGPSTLNPHPLQSSVPATGNVQMMQAIRKCIRTRFSSLTGIGVPIDSIYQFCLLAPPPKAVEASEDPKASDASKTEASSSEASKEGPSTSDAPETSEKQASTSEAPETSAPAPKLPEEPLKLGIIVNLTNPVPPMIHPSNPASTLDPKFLLSQRNVLMDLIAKQKYQKFQLLWRKVVHDLKYGKTEYFERWRKKRIEDREKAKERERNMIMFKEPMPVPQPIPLEVLQGFMNTHVRVCETDINCISKDLQKLYMKHRNDWMASWHNFRPSQKRMYHRAHSAAVESYKREQMALGNSPRHRQEKRKLERKQKSGKEKRKKTAGNQQREDILTVS